MFKRIIAFCIAVAVLTATDFSYCRASAISGISAECAVLYCMNNGEVLYEKNAHQKHAVASTTKIMTSLLACESGELSREITVSENMVQVEGTSMGLLPGDRVTLRGLVYGMLLQSGNDAANTTAITLSGSLEKFTEKMNDRAARIGMKNSQFRNPSGLTQEGHYSTAYDMALLAAEALRNDTFASVCSLREAVVYYGNPPYRRKLTNHNRLLSSYAGANGIKTGFTKAAGRCLVSSAERDGITLIAVTLNASDDWNDHSVLLDYGFSCCTPKNHRVNIHDVRIPVTGGTGAYVCAAANGDVITADTGNGNDIRYKIRKQPFLYAPVKQGDIVGRISVYDGEIYLGDIALTATENCDIYVQSSKKRQSFFEKIKHHFQDAKGK